jgi:four helix bundle protein
MARSYRDIRAWQAARAFKRGIYNLISESPLCLDERLSKQLRDGAASAQSNIAEGFGRFDPADFARMVKIAKASIIECQNHLEDAVDAHEPGTWNPERFAFSSALSDSELRMRMLPGLRV